MPEANLRRVRPLRSLLAAAAVFAVATPVRADEPDVPLSVFTGAAVLLAGFGVGGVLLTTRRGAAYDSAGWLTMEAGFTLAPLSSHAIAGEWGRGLIFAAVPAAAVGGSATVFEIDAHAVRHGQLPEQRVLWTLFGAGLFSSALGVVDTAFAGDRKRALVLAPSVGSGHFGLELGGTL